MKTRWNTLRLIVKIIEVVGWVLLCLGVVLSIKAIGRDEHFLGKLLAAIPWIGLALGGLLAICLAQLVQVFIATEENVRLLVACHEETNKMLGEVLGSYKVNIEQILLVLRAGRTIGHEVERPHGEPHS